MTYTTEETTVLIVEDDESIAALIADAIEWETGAHTCVLHDGAEAISFLAHQPVDLVVLDYQLPGANGIEVYDAMCMDGQAAHTPVLFVTANDSRTEFQRAGLTYIRKPFDLQRFLDIVADRLQPHRYAVTPSVGD